MLRLLLVASAVLLSWLGKPLLAGEAPTLAEILSAIERMEKLFFESDSLMVHYERTKSEDLIATRATGGLLPAEWRMAYRGGNWLVERRFTRPFQGRDFVVPPDPKSTVLRDRLILEWDQRYRSAVLDEFDLGRNIYAGLYYTRNLSLNAPKYILTSNEATGKFEEIRKVNADDVDLPFLPDFLRENLDRYKVLAEPELVDGTSCWVVQWPGMDRFYVDPARGYSIPRRVYTFGPGEPLRFEFKNSDYREVKPGLWLPFSQLVKQHASIIAEEKSLWGKLACQTEYRVHSIEFDNLPQNFFDVALPPGTVVLDVVRGFKYRVSGKDDSDPLRLPIVEGVRLLQRSARPWVVINAAVIGLLFLGCIVWVLARKYSARHLSSSDR